MAGLWVLVTPAAAHSGTTHAGTPHWVLFVLFVGGIGTLLGATTAARGEIVTLPLAGVLSTLSAVVAVFGGIGLVELQVVGLAPLQLVELYPLLSLLVSGLLSFGGFLCVRFRYPTKPQYALLCIVLAGWIGYPAVMPNRGYSNPLGYLIVLSLPVILGYIIRTDARGVLQSLRLQTTPKVAGLGAGLLMSAFFAFSAGTMSFNPDQE